MEADFSGYATKAGLLCSDGRTIMAGAFKHQDKVKVPLVWQHGHNDPENVLGHAILEAREEGMYANAYFNNSPKAAHAKGLVDHGDITMLSIWANELVERGKKVLHGAIREVSLVLSGANPGAVIENVTIRHSNGDDDTLEDEVIITTGLELEHAAGDEDETDKADDEEDGETVQDIYDGMSEKEKDVVHYLIAEAVAAKGEDNEDEESTVQQDNMTDQEGTEMTHNVFEKDGKEGATVAPVLSHSDMEGIVADAMKSGSLKGAVEGYAIAHGINQIDTMFPEAKALTTAPEFYGRRTEWVNSVLNGARKSPFSRVKTH